MNLWIAKLGTDSFKELDINRFKEIAGSFKTLNSHEFFQYKTDSVHYLSVTTRKDIGGKIYNSKDEGLFAYSGLAVSKKDTDTDFRDINNLKSYQSDLPSVYNDLDGQFSLIKCSDSQFEGVSDPLGIHKIFYHQAQNGDVFVSNYIPSIQLFKESEPNIEFYATWISSSGIYGEETEEKDVWALPEFGRLKWTEREGLSVTNYSELSTILNPGNDTIDYIEQTVKEFKISARYLAKYHQCVLTLSGGYDSRLVLEMFSDVDKSNLECYTYPDGVYDTEVAREIANYHGVKHQQLSPAEDLDRKKLDEFLQSSKKPFICYSNIFGYQFSTGVENIFEGNLKVLLKGDGGDTPTGLKKYSAANKYTPEQAAEALVDMAINSDVLLPEAVGLIREKMQKYYTDKYLNVMQKRGTNHNIASIFYFLERFGNYQSHKLINSMHISDIYLPFANINFLKAVFSAPEWMLKKSMKGSIHHLLHNRLTVNNSKPIHFASGRHWNEKKVSRTGFILKNKIRRFFRIRPPKRKSSYSAKLRNKFFELNQDYFKEVIHSSASSEFWSYFNKKIISDWIDNPEKIDRTQKKVISRVVPLIKTEFKD